MKKTVCLDFDGVCNLYTRWKGEDELFEPQPHLGDFISILISRDGYRVAIFSTRPPEKLKAWFLKHFPWAWLINSIDSGLIFFPTTKPPAICYVDDRAIRFDGDFDKILPQIYNFKAYWED